MVPLRGSLTIPESLERAAVYDFRHMVEECFPCGLAVQVMVHRSVVQMIARARADSVPHFQRCDAAKQTTVASISRPGNFLAWWTKGCEQPHAGGCRLHVCGGIGAA